ncbi:MAG: tetratricopeptide repeat protein [Desulfomonile tiedjei]|nr:tetratricopeptide repeat protein [Desulfomonile tiedjei]
MNKPAVTACCIVMLLWWGVSPSFGKKDATSIYKEGTRLEHAGKHDEAIQRFSEALDLLKPDERNAHAVRLARADAYRGKNDLGSALKDVQHVLNSPDAEGEMTASALRLKAVIFLQQDRIKDAQRSLTEAIKTVHENDRLRASCFADRAIVFINLDEPDKAVSDLNKALQLYPDLPYAYAVRGLAYLRLDKIESARRDSEHALKLNPEADTAAMARKVIDELSAAASGPLGVSVPLDSRGHMYVQVRFSKKGTPHRFMLDTGATTTLIPQELLDEISQETEVTKITAGMVTIADGTTHLATAYRVKNAFLYHIPLGEIEVMVLGKKGSRMMSLLGVRSMQNLVVSINNKERKAEIRRVDSIMGKGTKLR